MKQWWMLIGLCVLLPVLLTGCGGGVRQESWPGLSVVEDVVYAAASSQVVALNATTGEELWVFPEKANQRIGPFYAVPVWAEAHELLLVAGYKDQAIYALRTAPGLTDEARVVWRFPPASEANGFRFPWEGATTHGAQGQYVAAGVLADDLFLIGNGDGRLYALHVADGSLAWSFVTQDRIWASPVVVGDVVYITSLDKHLYALNLADGTLRWSVETAGAIGATPTLVGDRLWVGDFTGTLYEIAREDGRVLWTFKGENWFWASPLEYDNILYLADVSGNIYALDLETRQEIWPRVNVDDSVRGRLVLDVENTRLLAPGYQRGIIHAINTRQGVLESWGETLEKPGRLPGDLLTDGEHIYTMPILIPQQVQVFDLLSGQLLWEYPSSK